MDLRSKFEDYVITNPPQRPYLPYFRKAAKELGCTVASFKRYFYELDIKKAPHKSDIILSYIQNNPIRSGISRLQYFAEVATELESSGVTLHNVRTVFYRNNADVETKDEGKRIWDEKKERWDRDEGLVGEFPTTL